MGQAAVLLMAPDRRDRKAASVAAKKRHKLALKAAARRAAVIRQEELDEGIAPKAQRDRRLVRDGVTFRVGSPVVMLWKQGQRREKAGGEPTIHAGHVKAADRLQRSWEISRIVTFGVSSYGQSVGGGDVGVMSAAALASVGRQHEAAREVEDAVRVLGPLWLVVEAVALEGKALAVWADGRGMEVRAAYGYLRAGLDVLVDFYRRVG